MISTTLLMQSLSELAGIVRTDFALFDSKGSLMGSTYDYSAGPELPIGAFLSAGAQGQTLSYPDGTSTHLFLIEETGESPLVLTAHGAPAFSYSGGLTAQTQLRFMLRAGAESYSREQFFCQFLTGGISKAEAAQKARKVRISPDAAYGLLFVSLETPADATVASAIRESFIVSTHDVVVPISDRSFCLIRTLADTKAFPEYAQEVSELVSSVLSTEVMVRSRITYSDVAKSLYELPRVYDECVLTQEAASRFFPEREILSYRDLGVSRLISEIPEELCSRFAADIFGPKLPALTEEDLITIDRFFDSSLNISETARKLYLHRNTLTYRLDRIAKLTGLDIRNFRDAVTFKIAWMAATRKTGTTPEEGERS